MNNSTFSTEASVPLASTLLLLKVIVLWQDHPDLLIKGFCGLVLVLGSLNLFPVVNFITKYILLYSVITAQVTQFHQTSGKSGYYWK